jgi:hypothetical protein
MRISRGSVLLFAIAIVATLSVLAYGFVRVTQLQHAAGMSANLHLLAREAAITGVNHAIEQLVRDYTTESFVRMDSPGIRAFSPHDFPYTSSNDPPGQDVSSTTGGTPMINVNDMPATDSLVYHLWTTSGNGHLAYRNGYMGETGRGRFYEPEFYNLPAAGAYGGNASSYSAAVTDPTVVAGSRPVVKFGAPYTSTLDRTAGMFYDEKLRRVQNGDPRAARNQARYRLRYAVINMDLDGMLQINGDQGVHYSKIDKVDPTTVADPYEQRVVRNMHRLPAIIDAHMGWGVSEGSNRFLNGGCTSGVGAEHVFVGRGSTSNVDKRPDSNFIPSTFPYMYREPGDFAVFGPGSITTMDGGWPGPYPYAATSGSYTVTGNVAGNEAIPRISGTNHPTFTHMLMGPQFTFVDYLHATYGSYGEGGDARGISCLGRFTPFGRGVSQRDAGEPISRYRANVDTPWCLNLTTATPRLVFGMVAGYMPPGAICLRYPATANPPLNYLLYGPCPDPINPAPFIGPAYEHPLGATTLYLYNGTGAIAVGSTFSFAGGDTLHTVRTATVYPIGYVPTSGVPLTQPITKITIGPGLRAIGANDAPLTFTSETYDYAHLRTRDLFVKQLSPAFPYEAPERKAAAPNPAIKPDYHVDDFWDTGASSVGTYRGPQARYPGEIGFNGFQPGTHAPGTSDVWKTWHNDGMGHHLRSTKTTATVRYDGTGRFICTRLKVASDNDPGTHATRSYWHVIGSSEWNHTNWSWSSRLGSYFDTMAGTQTSDPYGGSMGAHPDSIWEVIGQAMGATCSTVQGQQYQYTNESGQKSPANWFDNAAWPGPDAIATSIQGVDRLFIRNLGSNPDIPNDPTPVPVWYGQSSYLKSFTPDWNLAALNNTNPKCIAMAINPALMPAGSPVPNLPIYGYNLATDPAYDASKPSYTATQRSQLAELLINDFRMSFFGSSPQYGNDFRPMDFNGDGKAACSCYPQNGGSTATEQSLGIAQYTTNVDANGIAVDTVASSSSNTFFSNTGTFILGKSRFWRILARGEVWDNLLNVTVDRAQLETVLCIDPVESANELDVPANQNPGAGQYATHIISQTWIFNGVREYLPKRY